MPGRLSILSVATLSCALASGVAEARPRGPSTKQIKAMQEQMAFMQLEMARYQAEMAAKQQELFKSFDENGDGKLTGQEKARYDKHLHDIQKGAAANPFALIAPVGKGPRPKSAIEELKQQASRYQAGLLAKQQEIFGSFDADGDGKLTGTEKSKFDKYMHDIQTGKAPNPFAAIGAASGAASSNADGK